MLAVLNSPVVIKMAIGCQVGNRIAKLEAKLYEIEAIDDPVLKSTQASKPFFSPSCLRQYKAIKTSKMLSRKMSTRSYGIMSQ